jgi:hypothetical protein
MKLPKRSRARAWGRGDPRIKKITPMLLILVGIREAQSIGFCLDGRRDRAELERAITHPSWSIPLGKYVSV